MNHDQAIRYSRHTTLAHIGEKGQEKLLASKVLVVGAGGLGSPVLLYLVASGVGRIGIVDDDAVELSNLQRQIIHETSDIGRLKAHSASDTLYELNPDINVDTHAVRLDASNIDSIIKQYDIVADGSDNVKTRLLVNDACLKHQKTLVSAAINGFEGQLSTFKAYLGQGHPCYRCLYPHINESHDVNCSGSGVLSPLVGVVGAWQASEVIKELLGIGQSLSGMLLRFNALDATTRKIRLHKHKGCICN